MKNKIFLSLFFSLAAFFLFFGTAQAKTGDVVDFGPSTNWYEWVIRSGVETGRGQTFMTTATTTAIQSVAMKLCRLGTFTKSKTLTLCSTATNGWYGGCQTPLASKTFTSTTLNAMINYDANCPASNEGGTGDGNYFKWTYFTFDNPVNVSSSASYFFLLNSSSSADNETGSNLLQNMYNNCNYLGSSADYTGGQTYYYGGSTKFNDAGGGGALCDILFKVFKTDPNPPVFAITSPNNNDPEIQDSTITVSGTCPTNGANRIGLTNDCLGFNNINYNLSCTNHTFSGQFYYNGLGDKRIIARDISSVSGDCVDYDNLMDFKTVRNIEVINGYPDQWYANLNYYPDYDVKILSPTFSTALTLPAGSTSSLFTFQFVYPASSTLSSLVFNVKQYDNSGNLLNGAYINKVLSSMANTQSYQTTFAASSTIPLNYVVQLLYNTSTIERQYPFAIYVSDLTSIINDDQTSAYLFPRLIDVLKTKIIFNYFFAFHDDFYNLFNGGYAAVSSTALDITFKTVSDNKQYNMNVQIFSASDPNVQAFTSGLRPYITAFLWITFATYVVLRVTYLFSGSEGPEE